MEGELSSSSPEKAHTRAYRALYVTENCQTGCCIIVCPRQISDPPVTIFSPNSVLSASLYSLDSLSTSHIIQLSNVHNSTLVDYANAVALCMVRHRLPGDIITGASSGSNFLLYSPVHGTIRLASIEAGEKGAIEDRLRDECIAKYNEMVAQIELSRS